MKAGPCANLIIRAACEPVYLPRSFCSSPRSPFAADARRPLSLDDLAKARSVGDPQLSPDGRWVAYTVGTVDMEKDRRDSDLWMVSMIGVEDMVAVVRDRGGIEPQRADLPPAGDGAAQAEIRAMSFAGVRVSIRKFKLRGGVCGSGP